MNKPNPNPTEAEINDFIVNIDISPIPIDDGPYYRGCALVKSGETIKTGWHPDKSKLEVALIDAVAEAMNEEW
jgi:hypothetical protein